MYRGLWWATVYGVTNLTLIVFHINHSMFLQQHFKCRKQDIAYIIVEGGFLLRRFMETGIKTITKKKKCKKAKWLSEEALQIAIKRREAKSKGEKERYTHLNTEFQRIAMRDKKAFLSHQCKGIEENNRMGKTGDLFKKIRNTEGAFHAKMGSIKDRNGMDQMEAEDIKKMWQEYTELYKKIFMT